MTRNRGEETMFDKTVHGRGCGSLLLRTASWASLPRDLAGGSHRTLQTNGGLAFFESSTTHSTHKIMIIVYETEY
eukprot:4804797-Amphidinium_carterae.1